MTKYALLLLLTFSNFLNAQWFESSASANIIDGDWDNARERALKKAVKNALTFSGGAISSLQQVTNGILVENKLILNSEGEIKALTVIDEQRNDNTITLNIKVDIQAAEKACIGSHYPKSVAVTRFKLNSPSQAIDGNIQAINQQLSKTLFNQLTLTPQSLNMRQYVDIPVELGKQLNSHDIPDTLRSLAIKADSQYVIYGEIEDLSVKFASKNSLSYWLTNPVRHFYLSIYLYDALQGELISTKQYRAEAPWQYNKHEDADLQSKAFWQKDYGQAILSVLDDVSLDIEKQLQCQQPIAKIISVNSNTVQINLGKYNGLKKGSILSLLYSSNYKDQFGIERSAKSEYEGAMKVIQVSDNSAILRTLNNQTLGNIQINDLARLK